MATRQMAPLRIQEAAQSRLTGDATLMGMITGVYAPPVPEGTACPYIAYGQHVDGPFSTFDAMGSESFFLLNIFSTSPSNDECYRILAEVIRLLHTRRDQTPLTLADYTLLYLSYDWSTAIYDPDSTSWNMAVRFLARAQEQEA